ncbi:hypothetical protein EBN03_07555 [Nocardia stercoris]|uniref:Uncharacterized protein n=1 Tax=Nocardia stercoris TaxID=2483361 RepID=A0A3M2LA10_9NOCA|nr:hypothetical protein EBN03_07555 [Nocardia stercoris]
MATKVAKTVAASVMALSVGALLAPTASADPISSPTPSATDIGGGGSFGSVAICFPLGSVVFCI